MTLLRMTFRRVPAEMTERYQEAWRRLQTEASDRDIRAWVFASCENDGFYVEFAECRDMDQAELNSALAAADSALERIVPADRSGMWQEWKGNDEG